MHLILINAIVEVKQLKGGMVDWPIFRHELDLIASQNPSEHENVDGCENV